MVLNMKKYIFPLLCTLLPALPLHAQKSGATQPEATAEYYINHYQFTEAEELINQNIKKLKRRRQATDAEESKLEEISRLRSMMRATERVTIIDSLVVDKNTFLSHIKLSPESGEINQRAVDDHSCQRPPADSVCAGGKRVCGRGGCPVAER